LSLKRVDAILRLKGMEASWIKENKVIQTGFLVGMEKILGVSESKRRQSTVEGEAPVLLDQARYDVDAADLLEEEEGRDTAAARDRYQRMFWESIPEGDTEPILPGIIAKSRMDASSVRRSTEAHKSDPNLVPRHHDTPKEKVLIVSKPGRPAVKFVDVGGKFIDVDERLRRIAESERRSKIKAKNREGKETERKAGRV